MRKNTIFVIICLINIMILVIGYTSIFIMGIIGVTTIKGMFFMGLSLIITIPALNYWFKFFNKFFNGKQT